MSLERISCPSCGGNSFEHDAEGNLICSHCGANFGAPADHIECPSCGTQNPTQARKCMNCGLTLGKVCPVCNTPNPPGVDHCMNCAAPLDTLSSVFMRTAEGLKETTETMHDELVRTKAEDLVFMEQERTRLDEEEKERLRALRNRQTQAQRQQRLIMAFTIFGGAAVLVILGYFLFFVR